MLSADAGSPADHAATATRTDPVAVGPAAGTTPERAGVAAPEPLATPDGAMLAGHVLQALSAMRRGAAERGGPLPAAGPRVVRACTRDALEADPLPQHGVGAEAALESLCALAGWGAADAGHPRCAGHLQTPPLAVAVAADAVAAALNQSLDSWDQAPAMLGLEDEVVTALGALVYGTASRTSGVVTTGGTEGNLMGLLLAREQACRRLGDVDATRQGLPPGAGRLRAYCSEAAHFSTQRMAGLLGLGEDSVVTVPVDAEHRMRPDALGRAMCAEPGTHPMAVVATAGTTDAGAVDPLPEIAAVARAHGCRLHVDAAYGGGALFSDRLRSLLHGLEQADSVALDLHKLGWQPTAAGLFLARGAQALAPLARQVAYLNTADDEEAGYTSLLGRSLRTTRRPDALKIAVTLRALGRSGLGAMVDRCHALAAYAAGRVDADPRLERALPVTLSSVVFRYAGPAATTGDGDGGTEAGPAAPDLTDTVNARIRRDLLASGAAVVGRCEVGGRVWLKLTLLNPHACEDDIAALLDLVTAAGARVTREVA
jgi:L-2,4-diaminobutyrate decarboxylase